MGLAKTRLELPWLYYPEGDRVRIINSHNFGGTWTPANTTTHLWLDAADDATIYDAASGGTLLSGSGDVGRIEDKSGNARHATQATSGNRPSLSGGVISFADKWLTIPTAAYAINRLIIGVYAAAATGWSSGGLINIIGTSNHPELRFGKDRTNGAYWWNGGFVVSDTDYGFATESVFGVAISTGGTLTQHNNGTQVATGTRAPSWGALTEFTLGKYLRFSSQVGRHGNLKELIVGQISDRQILEGYLAWKHGLSSSLPSGHPYKSVAP